MQLRKSRFILFARGSQLDNVVTSPYRIQRYLQDKNASCVPSSIWWIFMFAIQAIAEEANTIIILPHGFSTLVS